jgi:hypothetical protein
VIHSLFTNGAKTDASNPSISPAAVWVDPLQTIYRLVEENHVDLKEEDIYAAFVFLYQTGSMELTGAYMRGGIRKCDTATGPSGCRRAGTQPLWPREVKLVSACSHSVSCVELTSGRRQTPCMKSDERRCMTTVMARLARG